MTGVLPVDVVNVRTHGDITADEVAYARARIASVARYVRDPVLLARVKLTRLPGARVARPALVQANLDLDGRLMRAQVARATIREAVDEVHDRLRDRVQRAEGRWEAARHGPDAGRYDGRGVTLPQRSDRTGRRRPTGDDLIVRRKSVRPPRLLVDEAAAVMEMLDYPFFFFVETGSGVDSLLRADPASPAVRLLQIDPAPRSVVRGLVPVVVSATPAPRMSVGDAASRLDATGDPFLFFRDSASARGAVVYRRFDGRLGLLEPPES